MKIIVIFVLLLVAITLAAIGIDQLAGISVQSFLKNLKQTYVLFGPVELLLASIYLLLAITFAFTLKR
ncbi:hypothetical protein [Paenibacillus aceris]|uniref:DUF3955 domain-containing protein n=1 Tax=Paenibacillus aceris TaxID=869555 RepID=A0ABS4I164_9BACL|nr:hypothetical protein [Paenibacillus aceris]MBP1964538.1 hypothetical protein [Paenibacillus aceris]NHW35752.1 hypothetical protein [Paenibacillus aceris]